MKNAYSQVLMYVLEFGRADLEQLFREFNIPIQNPTRTDILAAIARHGRRFLAAFDKRIIRPYTRMMIRERILENQENFSDYEEVGTHFSNAIGDRIREKRTASAAKTTTAATAAAAQDLASSKRDPERGNKILSGLATGFNIAGAIAGNIQQNRAAQQLAQSGGTMPENIPSPLREEEKKDNTFLYVGIGVAAAIAILFVMLKNK